MRVERTEGSGEFHSTRDAAVGAVGVGDGLASTGAPNAVVAIGADGTGAVVRKAAEFLSDDPAPGAAAGGRETLDGAVANVVYSRKTAGAAP